MLRIIILLSSLLLSTITIAQGHIYTSVDANGHITITNKPSALSKPFKLTNTNPIKAVNVNNTAPLIENHSVKMGFFYKYLDSDGNYLYTDHPKDNYTLLAKMKVKLHVAPTPRFMQASYKPRSILFMNNNKSRFNDLIEQTAAKHQVDVRLVHAVIQTESAYDSDAISSAGAVGLMQLMPATARRFGVLDRQVPEQNVEGGIRYLRHLMNLFPNDLDLAVAAYNAGENAVMRYNNSIPPYPETINYVKQVLALYNGN